jgi:hypothetical protein
VRSLVAWHLGRLGADFPGIEAGIEALQQLLEDDNPSVQAEADIALQIRTLDIIGFKCCQRSSVNRKLAAGDDKKCGDCATRTPSPSRDPRYLLW